MDRENKDMDRANFSSFDFERIRKRGTVYVDKTMYIRRLLELDSNVIVSTAPRRMGKSLFTFTLESLFLGKRELFKGLYIDSTGYDYEFHPVIHIDFAILGTFTAEGIDAFISRELRRTARLSGIEMELVEPRAMIVDLVDELSFKYGSAPVILIDEYDRPLNSCDETERLAEIQQALRRFYSTFKGLSARLHLVYITGILKFSGLGIFCGLNNLVDISMDDRFSGMFGYTEDELRGNFGEGIAEYAEKEGLSEEGAYEALREMYDGYLLSPNGVRVYNPVSIGMFMYYLELENYWIRTGNMTIVINYARRHRITLDKLSPMTITRQDLELFSIFDFLSGEEMPVSRLLALLLMTGYLTIDSADKDAIRLRIPNHEVMETLFASWGDTYLPERFADSYTMSYSLQIRRALSEGDVEGAVESINHVLSVVSYDHLCCDELLYGGLIITMLGASLDEVPRSEEHTSRGRMDLFARAGRNIYIIETKLDGSADAALRQIEERGYADKYRDKARRKGLSVHLLGLSLDSKEHRITGWIEKVE